MYTVTYLTAQRPVDVGATNFQDLALSLDALTNISASIDSDGNLIINSLDGNIVKVTAIDNNENNLVLDVEASLMSSIDNSNYEHLKLGSWVVTEDHA